MTKNITDVFTTIITREMHGINLQFPSKRLRTHDHSEPFFAGFFLVARLLLFIYFLLNKTPAAPDFFNASVLRPRDARSGFDRWRRITPCRRDKITNSREKGFPDALASAVALTSASARARASSRRRRARSTQTTDSRGLRIHVSLSLSQERDTHTRHNPALQRRQTGDGTTLGFFYAVRSTARALLCAVPDRHKLRVPAAAAWRRITPSRRAQFTNSIHEFARERFFQTHLPRRSG
jgi:hypothetical protein